jgi:Flp pilus assembly protein TadG
MTMKRFKSERGAALLEAAITMPILLLISVGIFEFGRAYQTWEVLTNAAREGARVACLEGPTDSDIRTRVNNYLTVGGLSTLADSNIVINRDYSLTAAGTAKGSLVQVNYPFQFIVLNPVVKLIAPKSTTGAPITMSSSAVMRNE